MNQQISNELFARARQLMPGGVNSPVRAFKSVGGEPFFAASAQGAWLVDVDGNRYVDYVGSWGPMIAGHAHPHVLDAVARVNARRTELRRAQCAGGDDGGNDPAPGAVLRDGAHGQFRHRGDAVGDPPGARRDRTREDRQVRRLLPRPRRFLPGEGRARACSRWACRIRRACPVRSPT
jgi:hypothetical protein